MLFGLIANLPHKSTTCYNYQYSYHKIIILQYHTNELFLARKINHFTHKENLSGVDYIQNFQFGVNENVDLFVINFTIIYNNRVSM